MLFQNRIHAGRRLARALVKYRACHPVVLALPRGGVPVAGEVATALDAPLDLVLVRKIGVPGLPELALGAVTDGEKATIIRNSEIIESCGVNEREFDAVCNEELAEIGRRRERYLGDRARAEVKDEVVIAVDDGIATSILAAVRAVREWKPKELVLAVPVATGDGRCEKLLHWLPPLRGAAWRNTPASADLRTSTSIQARPPVLAPLPPGREPSGIGPEIAVTARLCRVDWLWIAAPPRSRKAPRPSHARDTTGT